MSRLYRVKSGVLFDDDFSIALPTEYLVNDDNHVGINNGLRMTHSEVRDIRVLRDIPPDAAAAEAFIDYTPALDGDKAGFILFATADKTAQLLEYQDDNGFDPLTNVKVVKNGDVFDFFMKHNTFLHANSVQYPFAKWGFITKSGLSTFEPLVVNRFICTSGTEFVVRNVEFGFTVEVESVDGLETYSAVADATGTVRFSFEHLVLDGTLRVLDENSVIVGEYTGELFAGDEYSLGSYLVIRKDGVNLSTMNATELGRIARQPIETLLEVHNPTTATAYGLELRVSKRENLFGYEWADVAWDNSGVPDAFSDALNVDELGPNESKFFWIKLERNSAAPIDSIFYFNIEVKHQ